MPINKHTDSGTTLLFTYGLLMTGTGNRRLDKLIRQRLYPLADAYMYARLYDLGNYPGAIPGSETAERVYGRLVRLARPRILLPVLDRFEDFHPEFPARSEFVRHRATVFRDPSGTPVEAWVYYYNRRVSESVRIAHGRYRGPRGRKKRPL